MGNDTVDNFLFLVFRNVVDVSSFMELSLATTIAFGSIKYLVYVNLVIAARILIRGSKWPVKVHLDFGCDRVISTVPHLRNWVVLMTSVALDKVQIGPDLPVDLFP